MKRNILILIVLTFCYGLSFAKNDDTHLLRMIKFINDEIYDQAFGELPKIKNWRQYSEWVDIDNAITFQNQFEDEHIPQQLQDSFLIFVANEANAYQAVFRDEKNYSQAQYYNHIALKIRAKVLGRAHPEYAISLNNAGLVYYYLDENETAETFYKLALKIFSITLGTQSLEYSTCAHNLGLVYEEMGDTAQAIMYYTSALDGLRKSEGEESDSYVDALYEIGELLFDCSEYQKALPYYNRALEINRSRFGKHHITYANSAFEIARLYFMMDEYEKAESYFHEAAKIEKAKLGAQSADYGYTLWYLGLLYSVTRDYAKAESFIKQSNEIYLSAPEKNNDRIAYNFKILAEAQIQLGKYAEAEQNYKEALKIYESVYGEKNKECASLLTQLGTLYMEMENLDEAEKYLLKVVSISDSLENDIQTDYLMAVYSLKILYQARNDTLRASIYDIESIRIRMKEVFGERDSDYVHSLYLLGRRYDKIGDYTKAEKYLVEAWNKEKDVFGGQHTDYYNTLNCLGILYCDLNKFSKAEEFMLDACQTAKDIYGENHPSYIAALHNLGGLYYRTSEYRKAETYFLEAHQRQATIGKNMDYATYLNSLGVLYSDLGDYKKAEAYLVEAIQIMDSTQDKGNMNYLITLNLGTLYFATREYEKAEKYYLDALQISKNVLEEFHPKRVEILNNIGGMYYEREDYTTAVKYYMEALLIQRATIGEEHHNYAFTLNSIGDVFKKLGDFSSAEENYMEALQLQKKVFGEQHSACVTTLNNLGRLYSETGNYAKAETIFNEAFLINKNRFIHSVDFMSERQRSLFWKATQWNFVGVYPKFVFTYYQKKPALSTFAYDDELFIKGLLLNASQSILQSIIQSGDSILIAPYVQLQSIKTQILHLEEKDPRSTYLEELRESAEQLEKQIIASSAAYRENQAMWQISWDSVRNHLHDNEVAVEYFTAPLSKDSTMYCALLLRDSSEYPEMIPLFESKEVLGLINTTEQNLTNNTYKFTIDEDDTIGNGMKLSLLIWSKILPYIKPHENIYFAPSGLLHQVAIEALPYDEERTVGDMYNLVRLSSTREIALHKHEAQHTTATLYGGIQYNMDTTAILAETKAYQTTSASTTRGLENDTTDRGDIKPLPWTEKEVENIRHLLQANNMSAQLYTSTKANEESFKAISGKHQNILHIATHGFYWADSIAQKKDYFSQRMVLMDDHQPTRPTIDPLNRCGLLFAGAQTAWSGHSAYLPNGVQDGILTAKEISLLDLRDADLVVLSACETGKGEVTGEGVFGLQRAFKMAGAQTIVMSLWPVNDAATQLLMTEFYKNWITLHQSKRVAFLNAQNIVRKKYEEPVYWAGFVMLD